MEETKEGNKVGRIFTPEQKFEILKDIERCQTIKEGLVKHQLPDGPIVVPQVEAAVGSRSTGIVTQ